ncbi:helix-turn-helix domain-containing protein [uncultured Gordonia sp.]|uniref:helix-turn-helix domain-containing protein n=1 Tax=uncultured Gordonia sp. TaxID=198437 RepID=UPI00258F6166|nr:helix-turn-helix transcriptional regulator [uncultured Gordonia sp.]
MTDLTTYSDMADTIEHIGAIVREYRRGRRLSLRAAATDAGVDPTTLHRIESGEQVRHHTVAQLLRWMDAP